MQGELWLPIPKRKVDARVGLRNALADVGIDPAILNHPGDEKANAVMKALLHLVNKYHDRI